MIFKWEEIRYVLKVKWIVKDCYIDVISGEVGNICNNDDLRYLKWIGKNKNLIFY